MKKIMLIYPSGDIYQRGEDRCQVNVKASTSNAMRACNDLGYISAILKKKGYDIFLKDYQGENLPYEQLELDIKKEQPDVIFISVTNGSIFNDIEIVNKIKGKFSRPAIILKGALFFNPERDLFEELDLTNVDYLIGGEVEFLIDNLMEAHFNDKSKLSKIEGISYIENGIWKSNPVENLCDDLDSLPFPDREEMNNNLYINPQTNKKMATINTSRGCPSSCIYCLSPKISGKKVRYRSAKNIFDEIVDCVEKYDIKDFFFKADTFTINRNLVVDLCTFIINSKININWVANSRANTLDDEMLKLMKRAGCSMIAVGFESGSDESLKKMKKGTSVEQNLKCAKLIKDNDLLLYGFYLVGFPWESKKHLNETKKLIFKIDADYIELSIVTPFKGTEIYEYVTTKEGLKKDAMLGKDSFKISTTGTEFLSIKQLRNFRKNVILKYHLRPSYIFKKLTDKNLTLKLLLNYTKYGLRLLKNVVSF